MRLPPKKIELVWPTEGRNARNLMANNKLVTIHQEASQRGGLRWNAGDGTFPLCYVILTNNVNEMASYLSPICMVVRGVKASLKVHPLCAGERIRASPTKRL